MNQNAIKITKLHYRNSLLASIAATKSDLLESLKKINLKTAINVLNAAWFRVGEATLAKCWSSILNFAVNNDDPEDNVPLAVLKEKWEAELRTLMSDTVDLLSSLNPEIEFTLPAIHEWNEGTEEGNADAEHQQKGESDGDSVSEQLEKIKPTEAVEIFNKALIWAGHEDVDQNDMSVLRRLREKAVLQVLEKQKIQAKITDFF